MVKRDLTLADTLISSPHLGVLTQRSAILSVQAKVRTARKFIFNADASKRAAEVIRDLPELLAREIGFARPPYDVTWIELDSDPFASVLLPDLPHHVAKFGYLIDHGQCYVVLTDRDVEGGHKAIVVPVRYDLHTPSEQNNRFHLSDRQLNMLFWGGDHEKLDDALMKTLRDNHSFNLLSVRSLDRAIYGEPRQTLRDKDLYAWFYQMLDSTAGDLRNIVALLLMLNRPSLTEFTEVGRASGLARGRARTYYAHSTVRFLLDPVPTLRLLGTEREAGVAKRRHEVRGHYCHNELGRAATCVHQWQPDPHPGEDPDDPDHWQCVLCRGKRWWRTEHHRGSAEVGFVVKDAYLVTP